MGDRRSTSEYVVVRGRVTTVATIVLDVVDDDDEAL